MTLVKVTMNESRPKPHISLGQIKRMVCFLIIPDDAAKREGKAYVEIDMRNKEK